MLTAKMIAKLKQDSIVLEEKKTLGKHKRCLENFF